MLLLFAVLSMPTGISAQDIDMSQVSLNSYDRTMPFLGKEVVDTLGTCRAVRAELDSIAAQGTNALTSSYGRSKFMQKYERAIDVEADQLVKEYVPEIAAQAATDSEEEFQRLLAAVQNLAEDPNSLSQYYAQLDETKSQTVKTKGKKAVVHYDQLNGIKDLQQYVSSFLNKYAGKLSFNISGNFSWKKASKALQKDLQKDKATAIGYLTAISQEKAINVKRSELRPQAEDNVLRKYIAEVVSRMPATDSPECYGYIHGYANNQVEFEYHIHRITRDYFNDREVFKTDKKKIITWKNPNYFKDDDSWGWLTEGIKDNHSGQQKTEWKEEMTHFPAEDRYFVNSNHPEYKVRHMNVCTQCGTEVYAAFLNDTLAGVSNEYAIARSYIDRELEQILCFYEMEHNQHNINSQPAFVKDCIRYDLVHFRYSNDSFSHDLSFDYTKNHKAETIEMSEQYIRQLHLDHKDLGEGGHFYHKISKFESLRTERIDGTTFRHYIGKDEKIVILQKFVFGNYCTKLFPFSKVTTFNSKDYVINKDFINKEKVLTCYYVVEKYE